MTISITKPEIPEKPQDSEVVLSVQGVSKKFCRDLKKSLFYGIQDITGELLGVREKSEILRKKEFWALKDVSFELRRGEALGLVGKNGSGKSTLLRIIAGLIKPDTGSVEVKGRLAPLIALGAGFNPILTGRENIYANMAILGLSKQEIDERFDDVVEFAEIGDAIDAPVQSYSSGMAARLGFASAIHTKPDILLVDEVLSVGDVRFRAKCHQKIQKLRNRGTAIILVSHNAQQLLTVCASAVYLKQGKKLASGESSLVMSQYEKDLFSDNLQTSEGPLYLPKKTQEESHGVDITHLFFRDKNNKIIEDSLLSGTKVSLCIGCLAHENVSNVNLFVKINEIAGEGDSILFLNSFSDKEELKLSLNNNEIRLEMPYLCLKPGLYFLNIRLRGKGLYTYDFLDSYKFSVRANESMSKCKFFQPRNWSVYHV